MLLLLSLLACDDQIFTGGGGHSSDAGAGAEAILAESCGGCHAASLAPTLSENICENNVDVMATQVDMPFITPGDPANSYVLLKMKGLAGEAGGVDSVMPPTGALSEADIQIVEDWIVAGAECADSSTTTDDTGDVEDTGGTDDTGNPDNPSDYDQSIPDGADIDNGMTLFNDHCAMCHVGDYAPDMAERVPMLDNDTIKDTIKNGSVNGNMGPVAAVSSGSDIDDVIGYLRTTYPVPEDNGRGTGGEQPDLQQGETLVNDNCISCHVEGSTNPPSFDTVIPYMAVEQVESTIINGVGYAMPSFNFTQEELNAITFYLSVTYPPAGE